MKDWCPLLTGRQFSDQIRLDLEESLGLVTISLSSTLYEIPILPMENQFTHTL